MKDEEIKRMALYDFAKIAQAIGIKYVLVGAGARLLVLDYKYKALMGRATNDWDLGIQVEKWEEFQNAKDGILCGEAKPFKSDGVEHRIIHVPTSVPFDVIPFGKIAGQDGQIIWPKDETRMSVTGFQEVYDNAQALEIKDVTINVASESGLAMLKVFTFEDRRRNDDMADFFFILENYLQDEQQDRAFEIACDHLNEERIEYDQLGPFILGYDLGKIITLETYLKLKVLLEKIADPYSKAISTQVTRIGAEKEEELKRQQYSKKVKGFTEGIEFSLKPTQAPKQ